jgi:hypothetical protein
MNRVKYYAGIGSRETPLPLKTTISYIANYLNSQGYILRSGGAPGADNMFEKSLSPDVYKEIYLPWKGFNNNESLLYTPSIQAYTIASEFHPAWNNISWGARKLMARNSHQVLGADLNTPVDFVVCWTPGGLDRGGTSQAMRIARSRNIPIFNLFNHNCINEIVNYVNKSYVTDSL